MLLEHNIPIYEKLEEVLSKSNLAIIVTFTGGGKSYIIKEYLDNHDMNALVIVPNDNIRLGWDSLTNRVRPVTYQWLMGHIDEIIQNNIYDCYIIDEAHHAGAEKWGVAINRLIDETSKPVIGLTADPVRYSDGLTNVSEKVWENNVIYGYSLLDAMKNKLIPPVTYIYAIFDTAGIIDSLPDEVTEELKAALQYSIDNMNSITEILQENIGDGKHKCIIFVDKIDNIEEARDMIIDAFPNEPIWLNYYNNVNNREQFQAFKEADHGFMIAVNMFNEGVHAPGVDTIIMLRRTFSPTVFFQQIGRAVSSGTPDNSNITVFDFVGNHINLKSIDKRTKGINDLAQATSNAANDEGVSIEIGQVIVKDYTGDIYEILQEIRKSLSDYQLWEDDEISIIVEYFPTEGIKGVAKRLPHRTEDAIRSKAKELGLVYLYKRYYIWTEEDLDILTKYFPLEGYSGVMERMPHRTYESIKHKVTELKIHFNGIMKWEPHEIKILEKYYPLEGPDGVLKRLPYRTRASIKRKATEMKIKFLPYDRIPWSDEEKEIIRKYYPIEGPEGVAKRLPHRTIQMIRAQAKRMKIRYRKSRVSK